MSEVNDESIDKENLGSEDSLVDFDDQDQELADKKEALETFKKQYLNKNYNQARETLVLARLDHHPQVMYYNGLLEMRMNNYDRAINFFKRVVAFEKPDFITIQSYICLGLIFSSRGNSKLALMYLDVLIGSGIESAQIYSIIGYCQMDMQDYEEALKSYKRALEFDKDNENIFNSLGYILILLGEMDEGRTYIEKALKKKPNNYAYLHSMGMFYFLQKKYDMAFDYFERSYKQKRHPLVKQHLESCESKLK